MLANARHLRRVPSGVLRVEPDRRSLRMGLHKRLDVGPAWPARRATHRGQCRPSCLLVIEELVCAGLYARRRTRLIAAPAARQTEHIRSGRAERAQPRLRNRALRALWADGVWTPETPRVR